MKRNETSQLVRLSNRQKNCLRWSPNETKSHLTMKFEICKYLKSIGEEFISEAIFADGSGRADILSLDRQTIIEVVDSEKELSKCAKLGKYPLPVIFVNADQDFEERLIN